MGTVEERAARIRWVLLDADGVLTDGRLLMSSDGTEMRAFNARDGLGIRIGQRAGLSFGVVSGRHSDVVTARATELGIEEIHLGVKDKLDCAVKIGERHGFELGAMCFIGDDVNDVPAMRRAGLAAAPIDAVPEARDAAHYVTRVGGGRGAVREVIDLILRASGEWERVTERYLK